MSLVINALEHGTIFIEAKDGPYHPWDEDEIWKGEGYGIFDCFVVAFCASLGKKRYLSFIETQNSRSYESKES